MTIPSADVKNAAFILVGLAAILMGLTCKQFYYLRGFNGQGKPAPRWFGMTLFVSLGALFVVIGMIKLVSSN